MDEVVDRAEVNTAIRALRTTLPGLAPAFIDGLIDRSATIEEARSAAIEELQRAQVRVPAWRQGGPSGDDPSVIRTRAAAAMAHRLGAPGELDEAARHYRSMSLVMQMRHLLASRNEPLAWSMSDAEILQRAISTSDLPIFLTETTNRILLPAYEAAISPLRQLARTVTASDFREVYQARISEAPALLKLNEDAEIVHGPLSEHAEPVKVETYARMVDVTFQALQNDDLGSFGRLGQAFGASAAQAEANAIVDLLVMNSGNGPVMSDGENLFDPSHGNVGTAGPPSETTIEEAVIAMRTQTGLDGTTYLAIQPKWLIIPSELEFTARKVLGTVYPPSTAEVNAAQGLLTPMVEPRLTDPDRWYVAADGTRTPTFVFANLSGFEQPQVETRDLWDRLVMSTRAVHYFGVAALEFRSIFKNNGGA